MNESELISGAIQRERLACELLYKTHKNRVFNVILPMVQNDKEAEDLLQETFIDFFENLHKFKQESTLSTWITRLAINKALESIRKAKRKKRFSIFTSSINSPHHEIESTWMHPGIKLENKENAQILFKALNSLKENYKVAFTLHKIEGLSHKEISEIMQISISAVETLVHRAKKELKMYVEKNMDL